MSIFFFLFPSFSLLSFYFLGLTLCGNYFSDKNLNLAAANAQRNDRITELKYWCICFLFQHKILKWARLKNCKWKSDLQVFIIFSSYLCPRFSIEIFFFHDWDEDKVALFVIEDFSSIFKKRGSYFKRIQTVFIEWNPLISGSF